MDILAPTRPNKTVLPTMQRAERVLSYSPSFWIYPTGLKVFGQPKLNLWMAAGKALYTRWNGVQWAVGDWLVYGEGRGDWGDMYTQAIELTEYSYHTLNNMASIIKRWQFSRRREKPSYSHHAEIAYLDPALQDRLLDLTLQHGWSTHELREEVASLRPPKPVKAVAEKAVTPAAPIILDEAPPAIDWFTYSGPYEKATTWLANLMQDDLADTDWITLNVKRGEDRD